jgi:hypothetical protein
MSTTRRTLLQGLASAPLAVGMGSVALPAAASPVDIQGLWEALLLAQGVSTVASMADSSADLDAASINLFHHQQAIENLEPSSLEVLAAQIMVETVVNSSYVYDTANNSSFMGLAAIALKGLLPHLKGMLAEDAAEFVNFPDCRLDQMRASVGIQAGGDA